LLDETPPRGYWLLSHRGDTARAEENTVAAFDAAIHRGADGVEIDVSRDPDGRWVTRHSGHTARSRLDETAGPGPPPAPGGGERGLGALVDWAANHPSALLNIELKEPGGEQSLLEQCRRFRDRLFITSYTVDALWLVHEVQPTLPLGLLAHYGHEVNLEVARVVKADWIVWRDRYVTRRLINRTRDAGLGAFVWEVDDRPRLEALVSWGVRGVITDHLDALLPE
jgi:glycerophosphoryl diester phosphodiesterase